MIHPDTEIRFISPEIGYGVVAKKFIPKGTITWVLDKFDREITAEEADRLEPHYQKQLDIYAYRNSKGNLILCWDNARFVNHSFNSNCLTTAYDFEVAVRDIQPGEQLTDDYGYLNVSEPFEAIDEGTRRKKVYPDDLLKYHKSWDAKLKPAVKKIPKVEQPLKEWVNPANWEKVESISRGEEEMDSILNNYYGEKTKGIKIKNGVSLRK